jgi:membrane-associated phospholipid phosphatase
MESDSTVPYPVNLKNRWYFFIFTYIYVIGLYVLTNRLTLHSAHSLPLTMLDVKTPFLPWTAWIYVSVYIFPLSVGVMVDRDEEVLPIVLSFIGMATVCTLVFIFYPTSYPRPPLGGESGDLALRLVRFLDTPANCMPSQHVALGFLSAFFVQRYHRTFGNWSLILGILIAVSTLTTKQHYVWDVVAGYFVARISFALVSIKLPTRGEVAQ